MGGAWRQSWRSTTAIWQASCRGGRIIPCIATKSVSCRMCIYRSTYGRPSTCTHVCCTLVGCSLAAFAGLTALDRRPGPPLSVALTALLWSICSICPVRIRNDGPKEAFCLFSRGRQLDESATRCAAFGGRRFVTENRLHLYATGSDSARTEEFVRFVGLVRRSCRVVAERAP